MQFEFFHETPDGKVFKCIRVVTRGRKLTQRIHVEGVGAADDPSTYGSGSSEGEQSIESMPTAARQIAAEIISNSLSNLNNTVR